MIVHSCVQVSDECRDVLRQALEADVTKRISLPTLLAHPWVTRDMPPALRSVNAELLAAPGGGQSRRQEAAAAGPAAGVKRHRSGELPMQVPFPHSVRKRCCRAVCRRRLLSGAHACELCTPIQYVIAC